jgi:hypothetical protein
MYRFSFPPRLAAGLYLALLPIAFSGSSAGAEEFAGNDLRDVRIGMAVADLPERGYVDFACASLPERTLPGWKSWSDCPAGPDGRHAVRFGFDPETSRDGTMVAGHPAILTLSIDNAGQVVGLEIVTDPKARLYLRKKAYLLGAQAMSRYGAEGWTCTQESPGAGEESVGTVYVKEHCTKTTAGRSLVIDRSLFRPAGQDLKNFIDETRITITQAKG